MIVEVKINNFIADYNSETGKFISKSRKRFGKELGWIKDGYVIISVDGVHTRAHRLAWYCIYGQYPDIDIDHINGDRSDNRINNLRIATRSENLQNLKSCHIDNKSSLLGVTSIKGKYWFARININGKSKYLGSFKSAEDAHNAYITEKRKSHIMNTI